MHSLTLGQVACEEKSNEITAIPQRLKLLDLKGCTVTIDAMGCQTEIVEQIREQKAHYVLAVKENQPELREDLQQVFEQGLDSNFADLKQQTYRTTSEITLYASRSAMARSPDRTSPADRRSRRSTHRPKYAPLTFNLPAVMLSIRNHVLADHPAR